MRHQESIDHCRIVNRILAEYMLQLIVRNKIPLPIKV